MSSSGAWLVDITGLICWFRTGLKYHAENYDVTAAPLKALGIHVRVVGGGRIKRDDAAKTISVYGYSKTFGRSPGCNEATAEMIRAALPGYRVDWSDEGY